MAGETVPERPMKGRGTTENRDAIVTPDEPDEDDLCLEDRRNRGWLV